ncbi:transcriptional regulator [Arachnia propionica]|uniref:Transcriptional regulator n=2 Tax=Arachnia propionica TaxID=1750 RepID=A0A3P1WRI2_9ACTN|nr:transcriptional regulator [Arachnia propionica]
MQGFAYKNGCMPNARVTDYEPVAAFFKALANPVRAAIVHLLSTEERTVGQLVEELGIAQPLVSQHLRVLRGARMVATRRQGQVIWYRICDQHIAHVVGDALNHTQEGSHDHDH